MQVLSQLRIVVTGGAGFLGRFVCERLAARDIPTDRIVVPRRARYDLTREMDVERMFADVRPDVIIHLAAEVGGIGANQAEPGRFFYANMIMGLHLIEAARRHAITKFVQIGTVCAYPKFAAIPFREEELWSGYPDESNAPYGIAKKALLVMCTAYREQYGLNAIYLIPTNLYGPGDNFDLDTSHVIPALVRKFSEAVQSGVDEVECWGDGSASRDFLYVEDAAEAIVTAAGLYDDPRPLNLGSGEEVTIRRLSTLIADVCGYRGKIRWDMNRPNGQPRRSLNSARATDALGFRPRTSLQVGLRRTAEWYADHRVRGSAKLNQTQLV